MNGITISSVSYATRLVGSGDVSRQITLLECDTEMPSVYDANWCQNPVQHTSTEHQPEGTGEKEIDTYTFTPFVMGSGYLYLTGGGFGATYTRYFYGSASDVYPWGECFFVDSSGGGSVGVCGGGIDDLYFVLYDEFGAPIGGTDFESPIATSTNPELPTSTYGGEYESDVPSIGFSDNGTMVESSELQDKMSLMIGGATSSFPLCVAYPWFQLLDFTIGNTATNTVTSISVAGGGIIPTTTISLNGTDEVLADIGAKSAIETIVQFMQALAWLGFGYYIYQDLFGAKKTESDETP